jgi:hypothetical protein
MMMDGICLSQNDKLVKGLRKTIDKVSKDKARLQKEVSKLKKELGILEDEGFVEQPSLPPIIYNYVDPPYCEEHGALLRFEHNIWRCEACKTSIQLQPPR